METLYVDAPTQITATLYAGVRLPTLNRPDQCDGVAVLLAKRLPAFAGKLCAHMPLLCPEWPAR